ncbi:uncharacterized protein Fot_13595 [Forsythia ovata]|uniref:Uncharacterized protein n=1 Tax=Forsythia ovata TaxID=205694 RepID=A0ABD1W3Y4_9LAMI
MSNNLTQKSHTIFLTSFISIPLYNNAPSTSKNGSISTITSAGASPLNLIHEPPRFSEDVDSTCSTPYVSAPSSLGHASSLLSGYFFNAPANPMHFLLSKEKVEPFSSKYEHVFF